MDSMIQPENASTLFLFHYYEATHGPFCSLSDLPMQQAEGVLQHIRQQGQAFASRRPADYLVNRLDVEKKLRQLFMNKGGKPQRLSPHYLIVGGCSWVKDWYLDGREVLIPLSVFPTDSVSFTYGDSFPAMRYRDGKPYRGCVFTRAELPYLIDSYGFPQDWNPQGRYGPERYIEAQVWADEPLLPYFNGEA